MLRIAICDDELIQIETIQKELRSIETELQESFIVECFMDGGELLQRCETVPQNYFAIIFFDIVMTNKSGIETAKQLRKYSWDETKFIFVTCHERYFRELYALETLGFVDKPIQSEYFRKVFMDAYCMIQKENNYSLSFKKDKMKKHVRICSIVYIEIFKHVITLHMKNGETHKFYATISEVWKKLKNMPNFVMPNKSNIINLNFVQTLDIDGFHMDNQHVIPIRQKNNDEILDKYFAHIHIKEV